jgi:REP element-mobilizing transposase RayT
MSNIRVPFEAGRFFHVFNHSRGEEKLFINSKDYSRLLGMFGKYVHPFVETFAYCLMPNHFHFLIRVKEEDEVPHWTFSKGYEALISHKWGTLQNAYTKKRNYYTRRWGGLFCQSIDRRLITTERYLKQCLIYIHLNPVKHGICSKPEEWKYSSFNTIISDKKTLLQRDTVIEWFDDAENFSSYHNSLAVDKYGENFQIDY